MHIDVIVHTIPDIFSHMKNISNSRMNIVNSHLKTCKARVHQDQIITL